MKCTKSYNARAEPLFCSLTLLFSDVPRVAVVVILKLLTARRKQGRVQSNCFRITP